MSEQSTTITEKLDWPLMRNNITRKDLDVLIDYLKQDDPILTNNKKVKAFEKEWSDWLGVKHSVMLNSGSSANLLSMEALKILKGEGEVIVPTLTWVSDIASVLQTGFTPIFVDVDPYTLGMNIDEVLSNLNENTRAVFITHILGYNALDQRLLDALKEAGVPLIEDVCESHGATYQDRKLGTFGWMSNFSYYYAHHMSTIEGGMVSTDDSELYEVLRMLRSHGMVREASKEETKAHYKETYPDLNPDFIFAFPAYNMRSTEINAVLGLSQLQRLDANNDIRTRNLNIFLDNLDSEKYFTEFKREGSVNYAFTLVIREPNQTLYENVVSALRANGIEFRRGTSGGGNQLRQPYIRKRFGEDLHKNYPAVDHIHFYGFYIGNYPDLPTEYIYKLCELLNDLPADRRL